MRRLFARPADRAGLAESFPLLTELRLAELGKLTDDSLALLHSLTSLKYLDISRAGLDAKALSDEAVVALLSHVGPGLETLVLNRNERLSDLTILEGIRPHCRHNLTHLELAGLTEVSGVAVAGLFVDWNASNDDDSRANAKLTVLNLHRCVSNHVASLTKQMLGRRRRGTDRDHRALWLDPARARPQLLRSDHGEGSGDAA